MYFWSFFFIMNDVIAFLSFCLSFSPFGNFINSICIDIISLYSFYFIFFILYLFCIYIYCFNIFLELVNWLLRKSRRFSRFSPTLASTTSPTGSSTERKTSRTASTSRLSPTSWTLRWERTSKWWRRCASTEVSVTTGVWRCAVSTPRLLADTARPSVSPRPRLPSLASKQNKRV